MKLKTARRFNLKQVSLFFLPLRFCFGLFFYSSFSYSQTIRVSSFQNKSDTEAIYEAMNSDFDTILIDYRKGREWTILPMNFRDLRHKVIILEAEVVINAKKNEFKTNVDTLWMFSDCSDIEILGNGALMRMNKEEYKTGEWRHVIAIRGSRNISIDNLILRDSGGDGILISQSNKNISSENITISNVKALNNKRQGISIISAENVVVTRSVFSNTEGTLPGAGLDIEPNKPSDVINNIEITDCTFENNHGSGIIIDLGKLNGTSKPVSIRINDSKLKNNHSVDNKKVAAEVIIWANRVSPVKGKVIFENCYVKDSNWGFLYSRKRSDAFSVEFKNCVLNNLSQKRQSPIINLEVPDYYTNSGPIGGFTFENLTISNTTASFFFLVRSSSLRTLKGITNITGSILLRNSSMEQMKYIKYDDALNTNVAFDFSID